MSDEAVPSPPAVVRRGGGELLVATAGFPELPAQAIAVMSAVPLNFVGNKLWSFRA